MVMLKSEDLESPTLNTADILEAIDKYAHNAALILLPGIQYFTGQLFDIKTITQRAHLHSIPIGWDLAHAAGNVELRLHDWDVDFAVWCNYKYLNSGPGAIASLFLHEKHGQVDLDAVKTGKGGFRKRFAGWWGGDKNARFQMTDRKSSPAVIFQARCKSLANANFSRIRTDTRRSRIPARQPVRLGIGCCTGVFRSVRTDVDARHPSEVDVFNQLP